MILLLAAVTSINPRFVNRVLFSRWLSLRLELLGNLVVFITALMAVYGRDRWEIHPGIVGLSVTYAVQVTEYDALVARHAKAAHLQVTQVLSWFVQKVSDLEMSFVSVERVKEYTKCPQEVRCMFMAKSLDPTLCTSRQNGL